MKRILLALFVLATFSLHAQTADEVVQKFNAKMGGLASFSKIKTATLSGTLHTQGQDFPIVIQIINGKAARSEVAVMGAQIISSYINGKGWKQNQFAGTPEPTEVTGEELAELKTQTLIGNVLSDYKARGHKIELAGKEDHNGINAFKILLTNKDDGKVSTYFINATDYSLLSVIAEKEMSGEKVNLETMFSKPETVKGILFYMNRVQRVDGQELQSLTLDKIELDLPIDEKIFQMPK